MKFFQFQSKIKKDLEDNFCKKTRNIKENILNQLR